MTSRVLAAVAAALLTLPSIGGAQGGGSLYSMLGIGDVQYLPSARSAGMGNTGIGLYSITSIHSWSPASWSRLDRVRMEGSLLSEGFQSTDGKESQFLSKTAFQGVMLGLPIAPFQGITIVLGMTPYSRMNFDIVGPYSFAGQQDTLDYTVRYTGTGGIGRAQLGASWAPFNDLSIGASFDFLFGSLDRSLTVKPTSSRFSTGKGTSATQVYGPSTTVGAMFSGFGTVLGFLRPLTVGAYASSRAALHTERLTEYNFDAATDTIYSKDTKLTIPVAFGAGLSYQLGQLEFFAADFSTQLWSRTELNGEPIEGMRDSYRLGAGFEFGGSRAFGASWWSRIAWRFGAAYTSTNYQVKGTPINEWVGTLGVTLPMYSDVTNDTRIIIALQGGQRGTLSNGLVKDTVLRMMLTLNIGQVWFIPSRED